MADLKQFEIWLVTGSQHLYGAAALLQVAEHADEMARLRINRKLVTGYWQDAAFVRQIADWTRAAAGWRDWQGGRFLRIGDNMRQVAVTEGDKVEAEARLGYSVNGHGVGDLVEYISQ